MTPEDQAFFGDTPSAKEVRAKIEANKAQAAKATRWHYQPLAALPGDLSIRHPAGNRETLERLPIHEAKETLGTFIAMDGNQVHQYTALRTKILSWSKKVRGKPLSQSDSFQAIRFGLSKSLQYPLAASTMTLVQKYCSSQYFPHYAYHGRHQELSSTHLNRPWVAASRYYYSHGIFSTVGIP